jgi:hypothetical protein
MRHAQIGKRRKETGQQAVEQDLHGLLFEKQDESAH